MTYYLIHPPFKQYKSVTFFSIPYTHTHDTNCGYPNTSKIPNNMSHDLYKMNEKHCDHRQKFYYEEAIENSLKTLIKHLICKHLNHHSFK